MRRKHRLSVTHALCQLNTTIPHANDCSLKAARQNPEELRGSKPEFPVAELGFDPGCLLRKKSGIRARQWGQNPAQCGPAQGRGARGGTGHSGHQRLGGSVSLQAEGTHVHRQAMRAKGLGRAQGTQPARACFSPQPRGVRETTRSLGCPRASGAGMAQ